MKRNFSFKVIKNLIKNTILIDSSKVLLKLVMDEIKLDNEFHLQFGIGNMITIIEEVCLQTSWNKENQEVDFRLDYNPDGMINYTLKFSLNLDDSYRGEYDFIPFDYEENNITKINFYDRWTLDDGFPTAEDLAEYGDIASHEEREIIERAMEKNDM